MQLGLGPPDGPLVLLRKEWPASMVPRHRAPPAVRNRLVLALYLDDLHDMHTTFMHPALRVLPRQNCDTGHGHRRSTCLSVPRTLLNYMGRSRPTGDNQSMQMQSKAISQRDRRFLFGIGIGSDGGRRDRLRI